MLETPVFLRGWTSWTNPNHMGNGWVTPTITLSACRAAQSHELFWTHSKPCLSLSQMPVSFVLGFACCFDMLQLFGPSCRCIPYKAVQEVKAYIGRLLGPFCAVLLYSFLGYGLALKVIMFVMLMKDDEGIFSAGSCLCLVMVFAFRTQQMTWVKLRSCTCSAPKALIYHIVFGRGHQETTTIWCVIRSQKLFLVFPHIQTTKSDKSFW